MSSRLSNLSLMEDYLHAKKSPSIPLNEIISVLNERAFGLTLLFLALPNAVGLAIIPGISTVFGIPILLISFQLVRGKSTLRLPKKIVNYEISKDDCLKFIDHSRLYIEKLEKFTKPRLLWFSQGLGLKFTGMASLLLGIIIALPLPFGNILGGVGLLILALGLSQDDGLFILVGQTLAIIISLTYFSLVNFAHEILMNLLHKWGNF